MASGAVFDAIKTYLNSNWTTTYVRFENEPYDPDGTTPFVDVEMTGRSYGQQSIGASLQEDNRWDEEGQLWLHVMVPAGSGGSTARTYAKQLADLFRGTRLLSDSLEFQDAFIGRGHPGFENGNYFRVSVYLNWRRIDA
jgi:hypothetical protein